MEIKLEEEQRKMSGHTSYLTSRTY